MSLGIFNTPDCRVIISSEKEPTLANCRTGCPFQLSRWPHQVVAIVELQ